MLNGLLPVGSVVLLKNSTKKVIIIGVCQRQLENEFEKEIFWDYAGAVYPEGYLGSDKTYLFNGEQIERIYAIGYQDEEQFAFKIKADQVMEQIRKI